MEKTSRKFAKVGLTIRGFYGEGTEVIGNVFQISNQLTLGCTEEEILSLLEAVALDIIQLEQRARARLLADKKLHLEDKVWRTYGVLRYARSLTSIEFLNFLSLIRLGLDLKILTGWPETLLHELMLVTQPGHMQKWYKASRAAEKRDELRAEIVKSKLKLSPEAEASS
jgi:protein arginine kinase